MADYIHKSIYMIIIHLFIHQLREAERYQPLGRLTNKIPVWPFVRFSESLNLNQI